MLSPFFDNVAIKNKGGKLIAKSMSNVYMMPALYAEWTETSPLLHATKPKIFRIHIVSISPSNSNIVYDLFVFLCRGSGGVCVLDGSTFLDGNISFVSNKAKRGGTFFMLVNKHFMKVQLHC